MKNPLIALLVGSLIFLSAQFITAEPEKHMQEPYVGSKQFEKLKTLSGRWEGTHQMGEEVLEAVVLYQVTSNSSAVVETLFPGTPHEMVSVYHDEAGKLQMTHYCSFGNQPKMTINGSTENELQFEFSDNNTIDPATEGHMHGLTILFNEDGSIQHQWSIYQEGVEAGKTVIQLLRVDQ